LNMRFPLQVMDDVGVTEIPTEHIMKRWTEGCKGCAYGAHAALPA
jgi:hypothetical protein